MSIADPHVARVAVSGLAKRFGGRLAVSDLGFRLMPGAILGLVGANGGGKTTTLRMLAGLIRPDAGQGRVLGADITAPRSARDRRDIGYMAQALSLYPDLTVRENLAFRARAHGRGQAAPERVVADAVEAYGLGNVLDQRVATLSGGWARRVQFAATVLHAPSLLLLDEPTAGLDVLTRRDLWRWIGRCAAQGASVVVSTHDLAEAETMPDVVLYQAGQASAPVSPQALAAQIGVGSLEAAVAAIASGASS